MFLFVRMWVDSCTDRNSRTERSKTEREAKRTLLYSLLLGPTVYILLLTRGPSQWMIFGHIQHPPTKHCIGSCLPDPCNRLLWYPQMSGERRPNLQHQHTLCHQKNLQNDPGFALEPRVSFKDMTNDPWQLMRKKTPRHGPFQWFQCRVASGKPT